MRVDRLAQLLENKYKLSLGGSTAQEEQLVRKTIDSLVNWYSKTEPIIMRLALDKNLISGTADTPEEKSIKAGHKFCLKLHSLIEDLDNMKQKTPLAQVGQQLMRITDLIGANVSFIDAKGKFPSVNDLIFATFRSGTKFERDKIRDTQYQKASKVLERIYSLSITMLKEIKKLTSDPSIAIPERFEGARKPLSVYDIIKFIRLHGEKYGISSREDWGVVMENDPQLRKEMTTVINALNSGHTPKDPTNVMAQIAPILERYRMKQQTNVPAVEMGLDEKQEQTRLQEIKNRNDERFQALKKLDPDPKFMAEQKEREIEEDRERLLSKKYESLNFDQWMKKGQL
jgi:hypothetical protein